MIRAGVPQSIAMRVTGHVTEAMFHRYDITDDRDKLSALEAARLFVAQQAGETPTVARLLAAPTEADERVSRTG